MSVPEHPSMRPFFILWSGQALSLIGSQAVQFALIWWLTASTGSATILVTASLLGLLPQSLLGPFIGALVDRWDRKRIMLLSDGVIALASLGLLALFAVDRVSVPIVMAVLFVRALGGAFHGPAMLASTTLMVPAEHLTRIQGLNQAVQGGQLIIAAPLGALLVASFSMAGVMAVDVLTALVAIVPLLMIAVPRPDAAADAGSTSTWGEVVAGVRYLTSRAGHSTLLGMAALINLCMVPAFALLPLLVLEQDGDAAQLGWTHALFGVGTIVGGVVLGVWGGFRVRIYTCFAGLIATGIATGLLGAAGNLTLMLIAAAAVGAAVPFANGPIQAVLQSTIDPAYQGRVFTLYGALAAITAPIGLVVAAPVADLLGVRAWYAAGALACVVIGASGFAIPALTRIERSAAVADAP